MIFFSPDTVSLLLDNILGEEKNETAIVGGIQVLLSLLDVYQSRCVYYMDSEQYAHSEVAVVLAAIILLL